MIDATCAATVSETLSGAVDCLRKPVEMEHFWNDWLLLGWLLRL